MTAALQIVSLASTMVASAFLVGMGGWYRRPVIRDFGIFLFSLLFFLVDIAVPDRLPALKAIASAGGGLLYLAIAPGFYHTLAEIPMGMWANRVYSVVWGLSLALVFVGFNRNGTTPAVYWLMLVFFAMVAWGIVFILFRYRRIEETLTRRFIRRFAIVSVLAMPLIVADSLGSLLGWAWIALFDNASLALYMFALDIVVLFEAREWTRALSMSGPAGSGFDSDVAGSASDVPESGSDAFDDGATVQSVAATATRGVAELWDLMSPREREIAAMILAGASGKEIGYALGIAAKTVENHTYRLYQKLGVRSRIQFYNLIHPLG